MYAQLDGGLPGDRKSEHRRGVVAEEFGGHHRDQVDRCQDDPGIVARGGHGGLRDRGGQPRRLHGPGQTETGGDQQQCLPLDRPAGLVGGQAAGGDHQPGRSERGRDHRQELEGHGQYHAGHDGAGDPGLVVARGGGAAHLADKIKVAAGSLTMNEGGPGLEEQGVAGLERDVADLLPQPLAVAGHGDHHRAVGRAKASLPDRAAHQRAGARDHRLDEHPLAPRIVELEDLIRRRTKAANLLQLHN